MNYTLYNIKLQNILTLTVGSGLAININTQDNDYLKKYNVQQISITQGRIAIHNEFCLQFYNYVCLCNSI